MRDASGKNRLVTRSLGQGQFLPLPGTEGALSPFFSQDSQWIGFSADGKLKKIAVQGAAPVTVCDAPGVFYGASWGDDDNIVGAFNFGSTGLSRIHSSGGVPSQVTTPNKEKGETMHGWPQVLPGSQAALFTIRSGGSWEDASINVVLLKNGERKTVLRGGYFGRYTATSNGGRLLYLHQNRLFAAPFDLNGLAVTGTSYPLLEDVSLTGLAGSANLDFSAAPSGSGTFVYFSRSNEPPEWIFWLDSAGKIRPLYAAPGSYSTPRFSPDGKRLAFRVLAGPGRADIWVQDLDRDVPYRLTNLPGINTGATWTPNSASIVFESVLGEAPSLYWIRADGSGGPQRLTTDGIRRIPYSFSPDGKRLAYAQESGGRSSIWTAPIEGDSDHPLLGKPGIFEQTPFSEGSPAFSPDGHWLAYTSNKTGTHEVYVRLFPGPGAERRISPGGGSTPVWSGRELFFLGYDRRIMVAAYTAKGDDFVPGKPRVWSEKHFLDRPFDTYDLAPDGKRFAVVLYADGTAESQPQLTVLLNFFDELRRRVPGGR
jgi:serine/threonine-protein kinase